MRLLFIIGLLFCQECKAQNQDLSIFEKFHSFFEKQQYDSIAPLLSENFILINELGKTVSNKKEYLNQFNTWDKAFNTKWVVTSVAYINGKVVSIEHDINAFNKYIYPWPMEYKFTYTILQNQLIQLQYDTLPGSKYYQNKDAGNYYSGRFYYWLQRNHPLDKTFLVEETYPAALRTRELFEVFLKSEK